MIDILIEVYFDENHWSRNQHGTWCARNLEWLRSKSGHNLHPGSVVEHERTDIEALGAIRRRLVTDYGLEGAVRRVKARRGDMLAHAITVSARAHAGQKDQQGAPYIAHPMSVAARLPTALLQGIAWMHDTVEDTPLTTVDLTEEGFDEITVGAVHALTRQKWADETYPAFIERIIAFGPAAMAVKVADLRENMREDRPHAKRETLMPRYTAAMDRLILETKSNPEWAALFKQIK